MCSAGPTADYNSNYWYHANWDLDKYVTKSKNRCECIAFNDYPADCGQNFKYEGISTPWCYVRQDCNHIDGISTVDKKTPWKRCRHSRSKKALGDPIAYAAE
jgi:hypothetical protein